MSARPLQFMGIGIHDIAMIKISLIQLRTTNYNHLDLMQPINLSGSLFATTFSSNSFPPNWRCVTPPCLDSARKRIQFHVLPYYRFPLLKMALLINDSRYYNVNNNVDGGQVVLLCNRPTTTKQHGISCVVVNLTLHSIQFPFNGGRVSLSVAELSAVSFLPLLLFSTTCQ